MFAVALVLLFFAGFSQGNCPSVTTFTCNATMQCNPSWVTCDSQLCDCVKGRLWRTGDPIPCSYEQKSRLAASLIQGLVFICGGISGPGECYLGNVGWCTGQIILSCVWCCGICFVFCGLWKDGRSFEGWFAVASCLACLGLLAHLIWWIISVIWIATGTQMDGNGCRTY